MLLRSARSFLRSSLFKFLRKVSETEDAKALAVETLRGLWQDRPDLASVAGGDGLAAPYPDLGFPAGPRPPCARADVVFITARFRSGSTFLWNVFRNVEGCTAYYEPLNERRWFDPALRGTRVDGTHKNVTEYWREYDGLEELGRWYRLDWTDKNLFMDSRFWDPGLKRYIEVLIERARGRPVLQFNRVDFRLPWLRKNFPEAKLVHLYRHPRDQWCSTLLDPKSCPKESSVAAFAEQDHFYLRTWARDLKYHFPFLDERHIEHPYDLFYYVWKLSYLFGRKYAHCSIAYEELIQNPRSQLESLFNLLGMERYDLDRTLQLLEQPRLGKWREYAGDDWFKGRETACEQVLAEFLTQQPS